MYTHSCTRFQVPMRAYIDGLKWHIKPLCKGFQNEVFPSFFAIGYLWKRIIQGIMTRFLFYRITDLNTCAFISLKSMWTLTMTLNHWGLSESVIGIPILCILEN